MLKAPLVKSGKYSIPLFLQVFNQYIALDLLPQPTSDLVPSQLCCSWSQSHI
ncbi:hypothetical protein FA15DRAFT_676482 [Coprinopsis marcescibilis]|uniref:Uncharacterized protein n=1 Tax=Coprinopsis marcescibilis TaxID=230819 RepID=A0A5C3K9V2_COPMA|nr:hypothetical protein FA15DRAFT_676482 [Coprinopsis marcescibilis]